MFGPPSPSFDMGDKISKKANKKLQLKNFSETTIQSFICYYNKKKNEYIFQQLDLSLCVDVHCNQTYSSAISVRI